jgi:hypothetical protein
MQNEGICKPVGSSSANATEARPVNLGHDHSGFVPNSFLGAVVLVGSAIEDISSSSTLWDIGEMNSRYWCDIEHAVAEATKSNGGIAEIGFVCERDFEYANVPNDRS